METETTFSCCSNPGCDQPGSHKCAACNTTPYCGPICQTAHWAHHRESCEGHLLKIGKAHFVKAKGFYSTNNWVQMLRHSDLALGKFNAMKKRPLESISDVLAIKCVALQNLGRHAEYLQCAKDKYNLWAMARGPAHPCTIEAAFFLIDGLLNNDEFEDAYFFARTLWEIIHTNNHVDNDIPGNKRQGYVAHAAELFARATWRFANSGGIPPEEKQKAGEEAIARARQSVDIHAQLHGTESGRASSSMNTLASVLDFFHDANDDEVLRLTEQAIVIDTRVCGRMSASVGANEHCLGHAYHRRAEKAHGANDLDRCIENLELALSHYREAAQIYKAINHMDAADNSLRCVAQVEEKLRQGRIARAATAVRR